MRPLDKFVGTDMWWKKHSFGGRSYELVGEDGETYARLVVQGVLESRALATMADRQIELKWSGLITRKVRILDDATKEELGVLDLGISDSGEFRFASGRRFRFKHAFLRSRWDVSDALGETVFTATQSMLGTRSQVVVKSRLFCRHELSIMLAAARYATHMMGQETAAIASAGG